MTLVKSGACQHATQDRLELATSRRWSNERDGGPATRDSLFAGPVRLIRASVCSRRRRSPRRVRIGAGRTIGLASVAGPIVSSRDWENSNLCTPIEPDRRPYTGRARGGYATEPRLIGRVERCARFRLKDSRGYFERTRAAQANNPDAASTRRRGDCCDGLASKHIGDQWPVVR